jgi:hypothetical protein
LEPILGEKEKMAKVENSELRSKVEELRALEHPLVHPSSEIDAKQQSLFIDTIGFHKILEEIRGDTMAIEIPVHVAHQLPVAPEIRDYLDQAGVDAYKLRSSNSTDRLTVSSWDDPRHVGINLNLIVGDRAVASIGVDITQDETVFVTYENLEIEMQNGKNKFADAVKNLDSTPESAQANAAEFISELRKQVFFTVIARIVDAKEKTKASRQ